MKHAKVAWLCAILCCGLLSGCSAPRLSPEVRPGFDLTGNWMLDPTRSDQSPDPTRLVDQMDREILRSSRTSSMHRQVGDNAVFAFIGQDFPVLLARQMKIEQSEESMGIYYEPGSYRDVSYGEKDRGLWKIVAGWNAQGNFIIQSDSDDIRAVQEHVLLDQSTLQIRLTVRADGGDLDLVRTFVRNEPMSSREGHDGSRFFDGS